MSGLSRYGPPIALMGVIYFLSAQPHLSSGLGVWDLVGRKFVHAGEYGLLFGLWWRAFGWRSPAAPVAAAAIAIGYSITDEFHQTYVAGRHGSPVDVLIDATGVLVAYVVIRARRAGGPSRPRVPAP